jgi:hypothetical protein
VVTARRGKDGDGNGRSGFIYVFQKDESSDHVWVQLGIAANNGYGGNFGTSLAISSKLIVVGDPLDDENGNDSVSAFVFDAEENVTQRQSKSSVI